MLRLRSDEQLVALFRAGHDEAFRVIHDRYRQRLFAYARQMLPGRQDAEDALQDVFVRAYSNLRSSDRELALRAWLYRVAHNRCVDELRRPAPPPPEAMQFICAPIQDPIAQADQRESLRRLVADVRRLPDQQRSALLMRELGGMSYADLAGVLGVSVPAVKSLLVRARMALALAVEARETACAEIREELILAHDRRVRPNATARRHMRDCPGCSRFRRELRGVSRQLAALTPAIGPLGLAAKLLGIGGSAGGGAAATGGTAAIGGASVAGGAIASAGAMAGGAGHIATLIAATVVTAGGAVEIQGTIPPPVHHRAVHHVRVVPEAQPEQIQPTQLSAPPVSYPTVATATEAIAAAVVHPASVTTVPAPAPATPAAPKAKTKPKTEAKKTATEKQSPAGTSSTEASGASAPKSASSNSVGTVLPSMAASATKPSSTTTTASGSTPPSSGSTSSTPTGSGGTSSGMTAASGSPAQSSTPTSQPSGGTASSSSTPDSSSGASSTGSPTPSGR
jgi:RNA polymerase sigma factor (sigma-70 family)